MGFIRSVICVTSSFAAVAVWYLIVFIYRYLPVTCWRLVFPKLSVSMSKAVNMYTQIFLYTYVFKPVMELLDPRLDACVTLLEATKELYVDFQLCHILVNI